MSRNKPSPAAVSTFADHEVIVPPNKLKKAVEKLKPGAKIDFDPVARAEAALAELAADFGFPMVAPVAESLCRLIEHVPDIARLPLRLVDQHVDAIHAITHKNTRGDGNKYAAQLAEKLRHVTDEFLVHENRDRPDTL